MKPVGGKLNHEIAFGFFFSPSQRHAFEFQGIRSQTEIVPVDKTFGGEAETPLPEPQLFDIRSRGMGLKSVSWLRMAALWVEKHNEWMRL